MRVSVWSSDGCSSDLEICRNREREEDEAGAEAGVIYAVEDKIARITLNRPHRRNAIDVATANLLTAIWQRIDEDESVLAAVIDAAECGTFCAGMDLKDRSEEPR